VRRGVLALDHAQTEAALEPLRVLAAVREALIAISRDIVSAPPRIAAEAPNGVLGAMPAYVPGLGLAAKLVSIFADPRVEGRSTHLGIVTYFDDQDGRPLALMDAGAITAVRTAASATLSMQVLAGPAVRRIAVIGTGAQARAQVRMLAATGEPARLVVGGRSPGAAADLAALHPAATTDSIEAAVKGADVVFCCTGARQPVVQRAWLADGAHVSSVGGSAGPELDAATIADGALYAEWLGASASPPPAGAYELQGIPSEQITLLGSLLDGQVAAGGPAPLTVFKSTGHAALDVAAAAVVYDSARADSTGTVLDL
jgi:ornithine cyclodeaminase/alanine dehydrogenase-like protein (mu-crystallin family)